MDGKLFVFVIIFILIFVGFSGCNELGFNDNKQSGGVNDIEIVDYNIETYNGRIVGCCPKYEKVADGFAYNLTYKYKYGYYRIIGKIKNNSGDMISEIFILVKFYDKNGSYLLTKTDAIFNLEHSHTDDFDVRIHKSSEYFEDIDNIKFEIEFP